MRTDQTSYCDACLLRFPAADRCPRCGGTTVIDLRSEKDRKRVYDYLSEPRPVRPRTLYAVFVVATCVVLVFLEASGVQSPWARLPMSAYFGLLVTTNVWLLLNGLDNDRGFERIPRPVYIALCIGLIASGFFPFIVSGVMHAVRWLRERWGGDIRLHRIAIWREPGIAGGDLHRIRGTVRVKATVLSPVAGTPCAAFRVIGEGEAGAIDDAGVGELEVVGDPVGPAILQGPCAIVDLEVAEPPRPVRVVDSVRAWLEERGVFLLFHRLDLAEAVLLDGDAVEVEGHVEEALRPEGYRGAAPQRVIVARDGAPPVIRRLAAPRSP